MADPDHTRLTLFYGTPYSQLRNNSWNLLRKLASLNTIPWIIFGDFNEVCFSWEVNSNKIRGEWRMRKFREVLEENNLFDLGFQGYLFTFSNKRMGLMETKACLDSALISGVWLSKFPYASFTHVATMTSDHYLLIIDYSFNFAVNGMKSFKFEPMWVRSNDLWSRLETFWSSSFSAGQSLNTSLHECAAKISKWNKCSFGGVQKKLGKLRKDLER